MRHSKTISILASIGILVSLVSLYNHYSTAPSSYCNFGGSFSCDLVNRSIYSSVFGIPVAFLGVFGYTTLLVMSLLANRHAIIPSLISFLSSGALVFSLYLTYLEAFVLDAWCIMCVISLFLIVVISLLAALHTFKRSREVMPEFRMIML